MQHLNLYSQIDRKIEPPFSARLQLKLVSLTLAVMVVIWLALLLGSGGIKNKLATLGSERQTVAAQLKQAQETKAKLENNPELDAELEQLKSDVNFRRRLLATIVPNGDQDSHGFAEHLSGLARQHIDGMWFTEIQLHQGGQQLALLGETKAPEYLPQYLQKLADEPVFEGHRFRVLRLSTTKQNQRVHSFELRAKEVGAAE